MHNITISRLITIFLFSWLMSISNIYSNDTSVPNISSHNTDEVTTNLLDNADSFPTDERVNNMNDKTTFINSMYDKKFMEKVEIAAKSVVKVYAFFPSLATTIASKGGGRLNTSGSGFIIKSNNEYYIITNAHVVVFNEVLAASLVQVSMQDGDVFDCSVVGFDSMTDIAVLKIVNNDKKKTFSHVSFSLDTVDVGDDVIAVGAPSGLENTKSFGKISHVKREIPLVNYYLYQIENFASPGSSGSPVFYTDTQGNLKVIGMLFAAAHVGGNLSMVIPTKVIKLVANSIIKTGRFLMPRLGIYPSYLNKQWLKKSYDSKNGIYIVGIDRKSPISEVLLPGDLLIGVDNTEINRIPDIFDALCFSNSDTIVLKFIRKNVYGENTIITQKVKLEKSTTRKYFNFASLIIEDFDGNVIVHSIDSNARVDDGINTISQYLNTNFKFLKIVRINGKEISSASECVNLVKEISKKTDYAIVIFEYLGVKFAVCLKIKN